MRPRSGAGPSGIEHVQLGFRPSRGELERLRLKLISLWDEIHARLREGSAPRPFLIVTPLGMEHFPELERILSGHGIALRGRRDVPGWPATATWLYVRSLETRRLRTALGFEALWRRFFPQGAAQCRFLATRADYARLVRLKSRLRADLPNRTLRVRLPELSFTARLHPFHAPDPPDLAREVCGLEILRNAASRFARY